MAIERATETGLLTSVKTWFKGFFESTTGIPNHQPGTLISGNSRQLSDEYFGLESATLPSLFKALQDGDEIDSVEIMKAHQFRETLAQDQNMRYNCSRRHALRTAANDALRISRDFEKLHLASRR